MLAALNLAYQLAEVPRAPAVNASDIDGLVKRLDEVLGHDGQLL